MVRLSDAVELLSEMVNEEEDDDDALLAVLFSCERAIRDFEYAVEQLAELEEEVQRVECIERCDEISDELASVYDYLRGAAVAARVRRAERELDRRRASLGSSSARE